jgi:serine/threonine protein kinase
MRKATKTGVCAGLFEVSSHKGKSFSESELHNDIDSLSYLDDFYITQKPITIEELLRSVVVHHIIGRGGFGTVYSASSSKGIFGSHFVIKLPNGFLEEGIIQILNNKIVFDFELLLDYEAHSAEVIDIKENFKNEINNITKVLTPFKQSQAYMAHFDQGRLIRTSRNIYEKIRKEAELLKRHSGYEHIHKFLHYNTDLFCIISEACDSNTDDLISSGNFNTQDHQKSFVLQVALAVHYLLFVVKVAHTDLKLQNILYRRSPNTSFVFVVSDFGYLDNIESLQTNSTHFNDDITCSPMYSPYCLRTKPPGCLYDTPKIMLYGFFACVLVMLNFPRLLSRTVPNAFLSSPTFPNRQYEQDYPWLSIIDTISSSQMHSLLYRFLHHKNKMDFWIYLGVQSEVWKQEFHQIMTDIVRSHNSQHPSLQYTIPI